MVDGVLMRQIFHDYLLTTDMYEAASTRVAEKAIDAMVEGLEEIAFLQFDNSELAEFNVWQDKQDGADIFDYIEDMWVDCRLSNYPVIRDGEVTWVI